jgi:hypothetical protein
MTPETSKDPRICCIATRASAMPCAKAQKRVSPFECHSNLYTERHEVRTCVWQSGHCGTKGKWLSGSGSNGATRRDDLVKEQ